jgi:hypothetical protein
MRIKIHFNHSIKKHDMQEGRERKVEVKGILKQHVPLFVSAGTEKTPVFTFW